MKKHLLCQQRPDLLKLLPVDNSSFENDRRLKLTEAVKDRIKQVLVKRSDRVKRYAMNSIMNDNTKQQNLSVKILL